MGLWVAAGQLNSSENVADNLTRSRAVVKSAAEAGAKLVGLPENFAYLGSDRDHKLAIAAGDQVVVAETPWGGLGLSICYDLRFPELYRQFAARGARMIAVPAAFTRETGKDHWHVLLRARAIENQCFVLAPAQYGFHGGKRASYGHALVVDPWGVVLAECGDRP